MGLFAAVFKLWDGTNTATVKPASTAPSASDTAVVVGITPNSLAADNSTNGNKLHVLGARANAANPSWTEGNQVPQSVDLAGNQRSFINSWFGSSAPTVGQKTSASSIPVVLPSDQTLSTVPSKSATSTITGVAASASSGALLAANTNRLGGSIVNDTTSATLYIKLGSTAATTASGGYTAMLLPGAYYEVPSGYTGAIQGIWTAATGFANVDELTA